MTALPPAFRSVDDIAGLNLNYRKCCWVQYGTEGRESLWHLLDYFLTDYMSKTLLGLFPFEPPKSWDRSVVIELRTSCTGWNLYHVLLVLGSLLASYASFVKGYAQLGDFILKNMTTRVVLDAQMNLTLSHVTTSVPGCTTYFLPSGEMLATVLPQRNHLLRDLITRVFLRSLQYGIVVMGFIDAFVYAHHPQD